MKKYKKSLIFLALVALLGSVTLIESTYAKYVTATTGTASLTIAKWNIMVNDQDVINNSDFSTTIVPTFEGSTNVRSGVIAPTAKGSFDVTIDMTNVDVSLSYSIESQISENNTVEDLRITSYEINGVESNYTGILSDVVPLSSTNRIVTITFNVEWVEDTADGAVMNNAADTSAAKEGVAAVDISINFTQIR